MQAETGRSGRRAARKRAAITMLWVSMSCVNVATAATARSNIPAADDDSPEILETPNTLIGKITIVNDDVFDTESPEEDKSVYRFVNKLHINTQPHIISQQLLFQEGDAYSLRTLEESERLLRDQRYIQEVSIEPVQQPDGSVDVSVHTSDVWTLMPKLDFSTAGGKNSGAVGLKEMNVLGTGVGVELSYRSDVDRDSKLIKVVDSNVRGSWYNLRAFFAQNSDGHTRDLAVQRPFYSMDSTRANGFAYLDDDRVDSLYDHGKIQAQYRHEQKSDSVFYGWSKGLQGDLTRRYTAGIAYEQDRFSVFEDAEGIEDVLPEDRQLLYPYISFEFLQDKYEKSKNVDQINKTEDHYMGSSFGARLGYAKDGFGSDRDAFILNVNAQTALGDIEKSSWSMFGDLSTRFERDGVQDLALDLGVRYDHRQSEKRLFHASLTGTYGHNLNADHQVVLGGDSGLRGYPLRYQTGDKRALLTLEQRIFTDWFPFRLVRVGGAIFFDAGRTWGNSAVSSKNEGLLRDIGFGLRLGNPRSGLGHVVHVDLAFPLDGDKDLKSMQFIVGTKTSF